MPVTPGTNQEVQNFSDQRWRPFAERLVNLIVEAQGDIGAADAVYANLTASNPSTTWTDSRTDGPPNLLTPADLLALNAAENALVTWATAQSWWATVQQAVVRVGLIPGD
jgi:hypothetical protein